jgi:hypothetical protein
MRLPGKLKLPTRRPTVLLGTIGAFALLAATLAVGAQADIVPHVVKPSGVTPHVTDSAPSAPAPARAPSPNPEPASIPSPTTAHVPALTPAPPVADGGSGPAPGTSSGWGPGQIEADASGAFSGNPFAPTPRSYLEDLVWRVSRMLGSFEGMLCLASRWVGANNRVEEGTGTETSSCF